MMKKLLSGCLCGLFLFALKAAEMTWSGYPGAAIAPPKVTTHQDQKLGRVTRFEVVADGVYQGCLATFKPEVNLADMAAVEFDVRHNLSKTKTSLALRFGQARGMVQGVTITPTDSWQKVRLPFDAAGFIPANGNAVVFDKAFEVRIYPYAMMDKTGEFIEIANFRFIPKSEAAGTRKISGVTYKHLIKPTSGDDQQTTLTDGEKSKNVFYREYSEEPDIVFDLGGRYAIDEIIIDALAAPSHNFSQITILSSMDGKDYVPAGSIANQLSGIEARNTSYSFKPGDKPVVGRYFRMTAARPRSDFTVRLSEVSFMGHMPSAAELAAAAESNYDTGKAMPERNSKNYYVLKNNDWKLYISKTNGVVNGAYYKDKLLVERFTPKYTLQSRAEDIEADGFDDKVKDVQAANDSVTVTVTNDKLPGLEIERTWRFENNDLMEKVVVVNKSQKDRYFLRLATETIFEQQFRKDGFYEMPSSALASGMFRIPATEVQMDRALTNIPTLALDNGVADQAVWHTRYRFNDRFTYYDVGTEEDNLQVFRANGWLLTAATIVPADAERQSFENRFSVTDGGMIKAYDAYIGLPDVAAFRGQIKRPDLLRDVRMTIDFGWDGMYNESCKRLLSNYLRAFSHRGKLVNCEILDMDGIWGDLPTSGPVRGSFGEVRDATEVRQTMIDRKAIDPRLSLGIYTWFWSAFPWSTPVKNHPEWFVTKLRNGAPASWFPRVNVNYLRFWGIPESRQEAVNQVVNFINYYEQDSWYVDGGKSGVYAKDWENMRIDDPLGQTDFYLAVREGIQKDNPDRFVVYNHSENPLADMGFLESFGGTLTNEWRRGAIMMWKFKLYNYKDPYHQSIYVYWLKGVDGAFHNYVAGISMLGNYNNRHFNARDLPFTGARYDIRMSQMTDAKVKPDWRFDWNEDLELMALQQLNNGWIFMHYHGDNSVEREVSADARALGMTDSEKPVYYWHYRIRDGRKYHGVFGEPQIAKAYGESGWVVERGATMEYLGKKPWSERIAGKFMQHKDEAQLLMVSQVPGVVLSVENDPAHYYLAGQPGVTVDGDQSKLTINNEYEKAVIGMILDDNTVPSEVKVNGQSVPVKIRTDRNMRLAVFEVAQGITEAEFSYKAQAPVQASALDVQLNGRTLSVNVEPANAPVEIYSEGTLVLSREGSFTLELPETVRDGEYEFASGSLSKKLTLKNLGSPLKILPLLTELPTKTDMVPVNKVINGIEVLNSASVASQGACYTEIDTDKLTLKAGTIPYYESHYNTALAAFELKSKRFLKMRIKNGVIHHTRYAYVPERQFVRPETPSAFAGLMIDFYDGKEYVSRTAAGFGHQSEKRKHPQSQPSQWGTKTNPERIFELIPMVYNPDLEEAVCWIDLSQLGAPAGWNGQIYLTLDLEHLGPDRSFTVEILETADKLPAGEKALEPFELGVKYDPVTYVIPKVSGNLDFDKIPLLGKLIPDKQSVVLETLVKAAYDDENIYFYYDCKEDPKHIPNCEGGMRGRAWEGDGVEFFIQHTDNPELILHSIVDAMGNTYNVTGAFVHVPGKQNIELGAAPYMFKNTQPVPGWKSIITLPWSAIGGKPKAGQTLGFNMMRNRAEQGKISYYTLSNNSVYLSAGQCKLSLGN